MQAATPKKLSTRRVILATSVTCIGAWICAYLATEIYRDYALGLFIWLPTVIGAVSTMIGGYKQPVRPAALRNLALFTLLIFCLGLLVFAWEGLICLIMAAPIGLLFTWVGYNIGMLLIRRSMGSVPAASVALLLSVPALMGFENRAGGGVSLRSVTTVIEIAAAPEQVWAGVIAFPELRAPTEFIFKTGIAYPVNATITGSGVGAIRHCNFSTGSFVEPITVWDEPRLLKFSVVQQPVPLKELSPFSVTPNHLHGYWVSKEGQFRLTRLPGGGTRLEGTTWYENRIRPGFYWSLWSDFIVHKIHERVLSHIKELAEHP
ncbi:MAG: hypothetical protein EOO11_05640 [Chitinophagaceae bacterium]|nr:MAG: hypothetical protein EOO11_05640 [Chitinophagaceae bacterium]